MAVCEAMKAASIAQRPPGKVAKFLVERLTPAPGHRLSLYDMQDGYRAWCQQNYVPALPPAAFIAELSRLVRQTEIETLHEGDYVYCLDVRI